MSLRDYIVKAAENKKGKIVEPKKEVESKQKTTKCKYHHPGMWLKLAQPIVAKCLCYLDIFGAGNLWRQNGCGAR